MSWLGFVSATEKRRREKDEAGVVNEMAWAERGELSTKMVRVAAAACKLDFAASRCNFDATIVSKRLTKGSAGSSGQPKANQDRERKRKEKKNPKFTECSRI